MTRFSFTSWLRPTWSRRPHPGRRRAGGRRTALSLEVLEDRLTPATFTVTSVGDTGDDFGRGSGSSGDLRYCLALANVDSDSTRSTIVFDSGVFAAAQTIMLHGRLTLHRDVTIVGLGAGLLTIDASHESSGFLGIFQVGRDVSANVSGLTLANAVGGGAIDNDGILTLTGCTLSNNTGDIAGGLLNHAGATLAGCTLSGNTGRLAGGVYIDSPVPDGDGKYRAGSLDMSYCTLAGNTAGIGGAGGVYNNFLADLTNCTLSGNSAGTGGGGGLYTTYDLCRLSNSIVAGNFQGGVPSDLANNIDGNFHGGYDLVGTGGESSSDLSCIRVGVAGPGLAPLNYYGGPTATMALTAASPARGAGPIGDDIGAYQTSSYSSLVVTTASDTGRALGQLSLRDAITLANAVGGNPTISFDASFATAKTLTLTQGQLPTLSSDVTITGPGANLLTIDAHQASGIFVVGNGVKAYLSGLTLTHGSALMGGAIDNAGGILTLNACTLTANAASGDGGGLSNDSDTTLSNCTLSSNTAASGGGLSNKGKAKLTNCTLDGNKATVGGGVINEGPLVLINCTLSHNDAANGGGLFNKGKATLTNCLVAGNTHGQVASDIVNDPSVGTFSGSDYDLVGSGGDGGLGSLPGNHSQVGISNALLAPLGNYGGPTPTVALLPGSPALNAGLTAAAVTPALDQRGRSRVGAVDIGAFESQGFTFTYVAGDNQSTRVGAPFAPLQATVTANDSVEPIAGGVVASRMDLEGHHAAAVLLASLATLDTTGKFGVRVTANGTPGHFFVTATTAGVPGPLVYHLTNVSVTGVVFEDLNYNGEPDPTEPLLAGYTVFADLNNNGVLDPGEPSAVSDTEGEYAVLVDSGTPYTVRVRLPGPGVQLTEFPDGYRIDPANPDDEDLHYGVAFVSTVTPTPATPNLYGATPNPDADTAFVRGLYMAVLGRDPGSPAGAVPWEAQAWIDQLHAGVNRTAVAQGIASSVEHRGQQVDAFYQTFLGREADDAGRSHWINQLQAGESEEQVVQQFLGSAEFQAAHADAADYVQALYRDVLGRSASESEVAGWSAASAQGLSRADLAAAFILSDEADSIAVRGDYAAFLHRAVDDQGAAFWMQALRHHTASLSDVAAAILGSDEFFSNGHATVR